MPAAAISFRACIFRKEIASGVSRISAEVKKATVVGSDVACASASIAFELALSVRVVRMSSAISRFAVFMPRGRAWKSDSRRRPVLMVLRVTGVDSAAGAGRTARRSGAAGSVVCGRSAGGAAKLVHVALDTPARHPRAACLLCFAHRCLPLRLISRQVLPNRVINVEPAKARLCRVD